MADNKPAVLGGTAIKPKERHGWEAIRYIIHNPETGEYFTRTPKSWALITLFYVVYYSLLAAFWAGMLMLFLSTLTDQKPKWIGAESLIGISPGLGMQPANTFELIDSSMIQYNKEAKDDKEEIAGWGGWVQRSKEFLAKYEKPTGNGKDCSVSPVEEGSIEEYCKFVPDKLGDCKDPEAAYKAGKPCIYLKLNKIYGVNNEPYNDPTDLPDEMPESLKKHIAAQPDKEMVWVDCKGEYPADQEGLGEIKYFPENRGFSNLYFPYMNQPGYQSPIVAVQFTGARLSQLLHVECRAWAKNIGYDRRDRIGINHLELHILDNTSAKAIRDRSD